MEALDGIQPSGELPSTFLTPGMAVEGEEVE
jgi:hypothetical protein